MVTHTLLVLWTAHFMNGIKADGESVHTTQLTEDADLLRLKEEIEKERVIQRVPVDYVVFRNVVVLDSVHYEVAVAEKKSEKRHATGRVYQKGQHIAPYGFALEDQSYGDGTRKLFGLTFHGEWTHMRYEVKEGWGRAVVSLAGENGGNFFFDVGNRVSVTVDELERVCKELEIW